MYYYVMLTLYTYFAQIDMRLINFRQNLQGGIREFSLSTPTLAMLLTGI